MKFALDAVVQWGSVIEQVLKLTPLVIVPVVRYEAGVDSGKGTLRTYLDPILFKRGDEQMVQLGRYLRNTDCNEEEDLALSTHVTFIESGIPVMRRLDVIDVEPDYVHHPANGFNERYNVLRTQNGYHFYPKQFPFADNGGNAVKDKKWAKGWIRVTASKAKGDIVLVP